MNKTEIEDAFRNFENKYNLPPVFRMSNGEIMGAFIITRNGESFMITFESSEDDILEAASMVNPDNAEEAAKDLRALKAFCSVPVPAMPAPDTLQ